MKKLRKMLVFVLAALMLVGVLGVSASAADKTGTHYNYYDLQDGVSNPKYSTATITYSGYYTANNTIYITTSCAHKIASNPNSIRTNIYSWGSVQNYSFANGSIGKRIPYYFTDTNALYLNPRDSSFKVSTL
ncbi:MAG: hypothetical protein LBO63_00460 [Oscillospiraceae bacterium]|jgi:hypothetical protein|nr:hypothetical protein [Oscillospiraceae bacterium]